MGQSNEYGKWLVIVNPNAGRRKGERDWDIISGLLESKGFIFKVVFTEERYHAILISRTGITEGYRRIIVVGGDGTMNEVVNGIFSQSVCKTDEVILGMISVGTGNDWGKMFNIPDQYNEAIEAIKVGKTKLQDTGRAHYISNGEKESRYFVNIAGLGFDASVVKRANIQKDKGKSGKSSYYEALLKSLFDYETTNTRVVVDNEESENDTFSISIGIGKFSGGGMIQTPEAILDDGLFDITLIKSMTKFEIVRSLKKLFDGSILDHPKIVSFRGEKIKIESDPHINLEVDGESLGSTPIEFDIVPVSIRAIYAEV
jgi:YegS/Rv2252/BmrU family lipid kinase